MNQPYPRLPEFNYLRPQSPSEAVKLLKEHGDRSRPYAGGTDCFVQIRDRRMLPEYLVDLKSIKELQGIKFNSKKGLTIGAAVSLNAMNRHPKIKAHYPVLVEAAEEVGGYQLRNRATLAGNLCNASPCGDTIGPCLVYGARVHILGPEGERTVEMSDFFEGPGMTCLKRDEIVQYISFPISPKGAQGSYQSIGRNKLGDLAIAAVTVIGYPDKGSGSGYAFRIALTAVAPTVIFAVQAEETLQAGAINSLVLVKAADACAEASKPIDDIRGSADYRRDMIRTLSLRGFEYTCRALGIDL